MLDAPVQAAAEGMPKFDLASIMSAAWAQYRKFRKEYAAWQIERGIVDASFSNCLKIAWRIAKRGRAAASERAALAMKYAGRAAERVQELTLELMRLDCRPWGMRSHRTAADRSAMISEITNLSRS